MGNLFCNIEEFTLAKNRTPIGVEPFLDNLKEINDAIEYNRKLTMDGNYEFKIRAYKSCQDLDTLVESNEIQEIIVKLSEMV